MDPEVLTAELRALWSGLLGTSDIDDRSNFFELGGHSMLAMRLTARAERALGARLPAALPFEHPVFGDFVAQVSAVLADAAPDERLPPPSGRNVAPLSLQQEQLMILEDALGPSPVNNVTVAVELGAPVEVDRLQAALQALVARNPALRLAVRRLQGEYHQVITEPGDVELSLVRDSSESAVRKAVRRAHLTPFDLSGGLLLRAQLILRTDAEALLVLHAHHLACDGMSLRVMLEELSIGYGADAPSRPPGEDLTYLDYTLWQRSRARAEADRGKAHWRRIVRSLVSDRIQHPTEPAPHGTHIARIGVELDGELLDRIRRWAAPEGGTDFTIMTAATATALSRRSGRRVIGVGTLLDNRTQAELERVVGTFATSTLLPVHVEPGATPRHLLREVREELLRAQRCAGVPLETSIREPASDMRVDPSDLVDVVVAVDSRYRTSPGAALPMTGVDEGERLLANPAVGHTRGIQIMFSADGVASLFVEHVDEPAARRDAQALADAVQAALRHFGEHPESPFDRTDPADASHGARR